MGRRTLLLIASILVAALGTALIWLYVQDAYSNARQAASLVSVLFLAQNAEVGTDAGSLNLVRKQVSAEAGQGAVTTRNELAGLRLNTPGVSGQILLTSMLTKNSVSRFPKGGAVALTVSDPNRVPADLQPGDFVDVYAFGGRFGALRPVLKKVRVRTVGPNHAAGSAVTNAGSVPLTIVGFDVDSDGAQSLYAIVASGAQPALYDTGTGPAG